MANPTAKTIGSSYVFFAALVLLLAACGQLTPPATSTRTAPDPSTARAMRRAASRS